MDCKGKVEILGAFRRLGQCLWHRPEARDKALLVEKAEDCWSCGFEMLPRRPSMASASTCQILEPVPSPFVCGTVAPPLI